MEHSNRKLLTSSVTAYTPIQDNEGCSDIDEFNSSGSSSESDICPSEFSVTPNTSNKTTPDMSPQRDNVQPSTSQGKVQSRGKDLTLLMRPGVSYQTPAESLYFREQRMARQKNTTPGNPRKSALEAKQPHEPLESKLPRKMGPNTKVTQRKYP